jgi:SpoIID/LytB domain protein
MAGVYYRALRGEKYRSIISYYYSGISFSTIDDNMPIRVLCRDGAIRTYTMREYLYRQAEEPDNWPMEGLKVTAVAMRTYAISVINRHKHTAQGYDICSSGSCCQAFNEAIDPARRPNTVAAVNATAGEIITYQGSAIVAAYSSCCGGYTASAYEVWGGTGYPYWKPIPDDACAPSSSHDWDVSLAWTDLEARLNASGETSVGTLYGIEILSRGPSGRVTRVRIVGAGGAKEVAGYRFAEIIGLPTNFFTLQEQHFDEYLLLQNPENRDAQCRVTYMMPGENQVVQEYTVKSHSRTTIFVNGFLQNAEVSAFVESTNGVPIVAERAMYFDFMGSGIRDGHVSAGVAQPRNRWYLAEGFNGLDFDSFILLQNPGAEIANVHICYFGNRGIIEEEDYRVGPRSRLTIGVDGIPGMATAEFSAEISSDQPIVAERAMYFGAQGRGGGSATPAIDDLSQDWYFAEGYTGGSFDTYILVMNPDPSNSALVQASFMLPGGVTKERQFAVPPRSRGTIHVDSLPGLSSTDVSTYLHSNIPVAAERAMYFNYFGMTGGHASTGMSSLSDKWYFAEGYCGGSFDTFLLLQNPNPGDVRVTITFMLEDQTTKTLVVNVSGKSRATLKVDNVEGMGDKSFATMMEASAPIAAERSMYFNYRTREGGSNSIGVKAPSTTWYFAEGYTGQ